MKKHKHNHSYGMYEHAICKSIQNKDAISKKNDKIQISDIIGIKTECPIKLKMSLFTLCVILYALE